MKRASAAREPRVRGGARGEEGEEGGQGEGAAAAAAGGAGSAGVGRGGVVPEGGATSGRSTIAAFFSFSFTVVTRGGLRRYLCGLNGEGEGAREGGECAKEAAFRIRIQKRARRGTQSLSCSKPVAHLSQYK